jgi:hypothetical protein
MPTRNQTNNMQHKTIEFVADAAEPTTNTTNSTPWQRERESTYQDWVFKPEYAARRLRFPVGETRIRILPPLRGSTNGWMLGIHAIEFEGGRFAHPRTVMANSKCAFDHAYRWAAANMPKALYSKANREGARLLTNPFAAFWAAVEEDGRTVARLFLGSAYDGSRGGAAGLGWQIWQLAQQKDESGRLLATPAHPLAGAYLVVEKSQVRGARYPSYRIQIGSRAPSADEVIAQMSKEETAALVPLEETIRRLTPEEEWQCLEKVIAPENVALIRAAL